MERVRRFITTAEPVNPNTRLEVTNFLTDTMNLMVVQEFTENRLLHPSVPIRTTYIVEHLDIPVGALLDKLKPKIISTIEEESWSMLPLVVSHLLLMGP